MTEDDLSAAASLVMMINLETFEIGLNKYTRGKKKRITLILGSRISFFGVQLLILGASK